MAVETSGLTIGEFGRRTGLSAKALRLYDVSGLLPPARVDPATGYRRYAEDQIDRARRISLLRQIDMPLTVVAEVLASGESEAVRRLDRWWDAQEASMRARRGSYEYLRAQLGRYRPERTPYPVMVRGMPPTKVATLRREVDQQSLVDTMITLVHDLHRFLDEARSNGQAVTARREHWVLYHGFVSPDSEAPIEVCVPFTGTADPVGDVVIRVEPARRLAYCVIPRRDCFFPQIMHAYDDVETYVRDRGLATAGPAREIYFVPPGAASDDDQFCQVAEPVRAP